MVKLAIEPEDYSDSWSDTDVDTKLSSSSLSLRTQRINHLEDSIKNLADSFNHLKDLENTNNNVINVNVNTNVHEESSSSTNQGCCSWCVRYLPACVLAVL